MKNKVYNPNNVRTKIQINKVKGIRKSRSPISLGIYRSKSAMRNDVDIFSPKTIDYEEYTKNVSKIARAKINQSESEEEKFKAFTRDIPKIKNKRLLIPEYKDKEMEGLNKTEIVDNKQDTHTERFEREKKILRDDINTLKEENFNLKTRLNEFKALTLTKSHIDSRLEENKDLMKETERIIRETDRSKSELLSVLKGVRDKLCTFFDISKQYVQKTKNLALLLERVDETAELTQSKFNIHKDRVKIFKELIESLDNFYSSFANYTIVEQIMSQMGIKDFLHNLNVNTDQFKNMFTDDKEILYIETIKKLEAQFKEILEKNKQISEEKYRIKADVENKLKEKYKRKIEELTNSNQEKEKKFNALRDYTSTFENKLALLESENNKVKIQFQKIVHYQRQLDQMKLKMNEYENEFKVKESIISYLEGIIRKVKIMNPSLYDKVLKSEDSDSNERNKSKSSSDKNKTYTPKEVELIKENNSYSLKENNGKGNIDEIQEEDVESSYQMSHEKKVKNPTIYLLTSQSPEKIQQSKDSFNTLKINNRIRSLEEEIMNNKVEEDLEKSRLSSSDISQFSKKKKPHVVVDYNNDHGFDNDYEPNLDMEIRRLQSDLKKSMMNENNK